MANAPEIHYHSTEDQLKDARLVEAASWCDKRRCEYYKTTRSNKFRIDRARWLSVKFTRQSMQSGDQLLTKKSKLILLRKKKDIDL